MKTLLILGAGTSGTVVANKMVRRLDAQEWNVVVVDKNVDHYYQPGFLFVPFGMYKPADNVRPKKNYLDHRVNFIISDIELIKPDDNQVVLSDGRVLNYDMLVVATGTDIKPSETQGLLDGGGWRNNIFDFYTHEGSIALANHLKNWKGGRLVLSITEMPIKCPVAPLEFLLLSDWYFTRKGMRDKVDLVLATPLSGAFTKPKAKAVLGDLLESRNISIETEFNIGEVDNTRQMIKSYDEREIPYDLLVSVPTNMGSDVIERSEMGDDLNFLPVNKNTLQSEKWPNVWGIGDATNAPTSKAGSVAHFMAETLIENLQRAVKGLEPEPSFDGHANCFIESGYGKAVLIDFNYDVEPLPGTYPVPGIGPMNLLKETQLNHLGKLGFYYLYWEVFLRGLPIPLNPKMSMLGKIRD
ncbi:MAG: NAD(P)/FAD-dependent oxidoreductase [Anaerolineae bacterium]|nr:NAD(P)/FAD-dependent oxidoreductase [Anaerolineae bacterium]